MDLSTWVIAQQTAPGGGEFLPTILMFGVIFLIFWVILIRPQRKEMERHQAFLAGLKIGDEVVTAGGIFGKVAAVDGPIVQLEIARGTKIKVERQRIQKTPDAAQEEPKGSKNDSKNNDEAKAGDSGKKKKK